MPHVRSDLFAVVWKDRPGVIVEQTGAPFDGGSIEQATAECEATFGPHPEWVLVALTPELEVQYLELGW